MAYLEISKIPVLPLLYEKKLFDPILAPIVSRMVFDGKYCPVGTPVRSFFLIFLVVFIIYNKCARTRIIELNLFAIQ